MPTRRTVLALIASAALPAKAAPVAWAAKLVTAAEAQIGVTVTYDPSYVSMSYPGGDVATERGVCTDVVIRAYRAGLGIDLQRLVHEDMARNFDAYPRLWGLSRPDRNIDHRRVPNLQSFFRRRGASLVVTDAADDYQPGNLVTMRLPGNLPHIGVVSDRRRGERPLIIHNIGAGAELADVLFVYPLTGHYRYSGG